MKRKQHSCVAFTLLNETLFGHTYTNEAHRKRDVLQQLLDTIYLYEYIRTFQLMSYDCNSVMVQF